VSPRNDLFARVVLTFFAGLCDEHKHTLHMSIARVRNAKNNSDSDHIANHNNTINSVDVIVGPKL
jgi:hypothetical protein